ncbi:MAG: hypothetical protein K0R90_1539 [Oscillospiraceae bacterium]|jgi:type II secretory pathway pseudopilin PulG|nr:hypothetical protein [Oscillospiraceae bacterium]
MKFKKDVRGMTLVETMVGSVMLVICGLILFTGFSAASSFIRKGIDLKNNGQHAAAVADSTEESNPDIRTSQKDGTISFGVDGSTIVIDGKFKSAYDEEKESIFNVFTPTP